MFLYVFYLLNVKIFQGNLVPRVWSRPPFKVAGETIHWTFSGKLFEIFLELERLHCNVLNLSNIIRTLQCKWTASYVWTFLMKNCFVLNVTY